MRVLFDHGAPAPLISFLTGHIVAKAKDQGWDRLANGDLLKAAEEAGFEVFVTTEKNIRYQQDLRNRTIALVVLEHSQWPLVKRFAKNVAAAIDAATPGSYVEVEVPYTS